MGPWERWKCGGLCNSDKSIKAGFSDEFAEQCRAVARSETSSPSLEISTGGGGSERAAMTPRASGGDHVLQVYAEPEPTSPDAREQEKGRRHQRGNISRTCLRSRCPHDIGPKPGEGDR